MSAKDYLPFFAAPKPKINPAAEVKQPNLSKKFRPKSLGLAFNTGYSALDHLRNRSRAVFEESPYDFDQIIAAIDTDSYVKQAFMKYQDLFWKSGWTIVSENPDAVNYLHQRIDLMEEIMGQPFNEFLLDVVDQLVKFGNVFIAKAYGNLDPFFRIGNEKNVIGYYIIPTQNVRILRDRHNKPVAYRQDLEDHAAYSKNNKAPEWDASEVIHLSLDKKPGHAFGTPFVTAALDDVIALRQLEQDIQNLAHRELFPVYLYTVGTEGMPSTPEELIAAQSELENMRVEGGLIVPERHSVSVIGAESTSLDISDYLSHFKERVAIGLGVFPHHLGMATQGTNRSATDRLDTALYDRIKKLQGIVEHRIRLTIFNALLREGGFRPITSPSFDGVSDRCYMKFNEIDIDTQVKSENHTVNKFNSNVIDLDEARMELGMSDPIDMNKIMMVLSAMVSTQQQIEVTKAAAAYAPKPAATSPGGKASAPAPKKPDAIPSSTGVVPNLPNAKKGTGNVSAPSNQHGRRTSPNIRRSDDEDLNIIETNTLDSVIELLEDYEPVPLKENENES